MTTRNIDALFNAKHIALLGADPRPGSIGYGVAENLLASRNERKISLVNPNSPDVLGMPTVPTLDAIDAALELVIIATPPETVVGFAAQAKAKGCKAIIVVSASAGGNNRTLSRSLRMLSKGSETRILGPDSQGIWAASSGLNATLSSERPSPGALGLLAQSGAIMNTVLDWGHASNIGFSKAMSLGEACDVDLDDMLDYLAYDVRTRAILVCVEEIGNPRRFFSAARAAAKVKPVVMLKSGRHHRPTQKQMTHAANLAVHDEVCSAVFNRAGLLRVHDLGELFGAAGALARLKAPSETSKRLAMVTNDRGIGVLSADALIDLGGEIAKLDGQTKQILASAAPLNWSGTLPLDLDPQLPFERHQQLIEALIADKNNDAVLLAYGPTRLWKGGEEAQGVVDLIKACTEHKSRPKPLLLAWMDRDPAGIDVLDKAEIAWFRTPADAVRGFLNIARYNLAQRELAATPPALPKDLASADVARVRSTCDGALSEGRSWLNTDEIRDVLATFGFEYAVPLRAATPALAGEAAAQILSSTDAVAVKIDSPDLPHKARVDGVTLNLRSAEAAEAAAEELLHRVKHKAPDARIEGVAVQPMVDAAQGLELFMGLADDPVFGPVVIFGRGGVAVEALNDKALGLPPLDLRLAQQLLDKTRIGAAQLGLSAGRALDTGKICDALVRLSHMSADIPQIKRLDFNPIVALPDRLVVLDARIEVAGSPVGDATFDTNPRMTIRPYPRNWERRLKLKSGDTLFVRPVRPDDEPAFRTFFASCSREDLRLRFFSYVREFSHNFIARLTQIDYARDMAFCAFDGEDNLVGVVRLHADSEREAGEYAILLRSDLKGQGLGWALMQLVIEYGKEERFQRIEGQVLAENTTMISMCKALGFKVRMDPEERDVVFAELDLSNVSEASN